MLLCAPAAAQLAEEGVEGPLANDTFLPLAPDASVELRAGDLALARARGLLAEEPEQAQRELARAFEAWRAGLQAARRGELVPADDLDREREPPRTTGPPDAKAAAPRCAEDVGEAVLRRLALLAPDEARAWRERFEPLAAPALATARDAGALARVLAEHPGTEAAARAALRAGDVALEEGRPTRAAGWLARAEEAARLAAVAERFAAPLARRRALLERLQPAPAAERWTSAERFDSVRWVSFPSLRGPRAPRPGSERAGRRLRPGGVLLDDGSLAVQTLERLFVLDAEGGLVALTLSTLLESLGFAYQAPFGDPGGDWPLAPASDGERVVLVVGRSSFGGGNALLCLRPPALGRVAEVLWALSAQGELHPEAEEPAARTLAPRPAPREERAPSEEGATPLEAEAEHEAARASAPDERELEEGEWDFQPGVLVAGDLVLVQARHWPGESGGRRAEARAQAHLLALELASGRVRWRRFLGLGADRPAEASGALPVRRGFDSPAQPLVRVGERVFAPTGLGLGALVELVDGHVRWVVRTRRHPPEGRGFESSSAPRVVAGAPRSSEAPLLVWGPSDSDHLYRLHARSAGRSPSELLAARPAPIGDALELLAASRAEELLLARSGPRLALAERELASGAELDLLLLGREERFLGAALAAPRRLLVATERGLLVLDRERDLFLLDQLPLPAEEELAGASLLARDGRVWLVSGAGVWELAARD